MGWASASDQLALVAAGEARPDELRDAGIVRCEALDPEIGFLASAGYDRAPPGVPMLLKDAGQEIAGTPYWAGLAAVRDVGHTSTRTTALAARFERAGFSVVGRSACPPLANGITTEPPGFPPTRNPWDTTRSVGGSSGGAAAAVACGAVPIAHGSDATGSLRFPAALCGLVTLAPTAGTIDGVPPCGQPPGRLWRDFVLAREVGDLALVLGILTGGSAATPEPDRRGRVGVLDHDPELGLPVDPACARAVRRVAALLEGFGHAVEAGWPPALDHLWQRAGSALGVVSDASRPAARRWVEGILGRPVVAGELPDEVVAAVDRDAARTDDERAGARATVDAAVAPLLDWWSDHDLLVTPATFAAGWPLGGRPGPAECGTLAAPFSFTGQPSVVVPVLDDPVGVPVGVQVVGRPGSDRALLGLAGALQGELGWLARRPPVFAGEADG